MIRKGRLLILASILIVPFFLSSCGNDGSGKNAPDVSVIIDPDAGSDGDAAGGSGITDDSGDYVLLIETEEGILNINGEGLDPEDYKSAISAVDENGNTCTVKVDEETGNITVKPADGTVEGTYTVTIAADGRVYELVVTVDGDGNASVSSATSTAEGYSMVLNLDGGVLGEGENSLIITSEGVVTGYTLDESIESIVVKDKNGNVIEAGVDPVTGDLVAAGEGSGPYTIVITTGDGSVITITADSDGNFTGITVNGSTLILDLDSGSLTSEGITLNITEQDGGSWAIADGVEILSVSAAGGTIAIDPAIIWINQATGDIMIPGTLTPVGPYEIRISVNGEIYIILTDAAGAVTGIIPGNTILALNNGFVNFNGEDRVQVASLNGSSWSQCGSISGLTATDREGNDVTISVNSGNGDIVTSGSFTDPVTIIFNYTDDKGNVITYTIVVANGSVISYQALITDPGPDFDFSTVTCVKITLKVVDGKTGLAIGQASINLVNSNGTYKWEGFTDSEGISLFEATVENAAGTARIVVSREGYCNVDCEISGIGRLIEFGKKIAMEPVEGAVVTDTDGDGVADADEDPEFVNDPTAAKAVSGVYTLAFEDNYPYRGDADFNDLVVRLSIREIIDGQNRVRRIELKTKLLASGAGYTNKFAINILGTRYLLIADPKADGDYTLGDNWNSEPHFAYHECDEYTHPTIVFSEGVERSALGPMPYDPFIICDGVEVNQVHLPSAKTDFAGIVKDSEGFTWAVIVPEDWAWPYENTEGLHWHGFILYAAHPNSIFKAYPEFDDWYQSGGTISADWYLKPDTKYTFDK